MSSRALLTTAAAAVLALAVLQPSTRPLRAQVRPESRVVPRDEYFLALRGFYTGDYRTAGRNFRQVASGGVRSTEGRWVDSICYHTMTGECYYQLGQLELALKEYESALKLYIRHHDWMLRVQFPDALGPSNLRQRIPWGASARRSVPARFPATMQSFQGRLDNENVIRGGGVIVQPQFYPLRVTEIVRCTALALRRRLELMGPAGAHSLLSTQLVDTLSRRGAPANHWSQVWVEAQLGLAQACAGDKASAVRSLTRAVTAGEYDHTLTPIVLLELGKLALAENRLDAAGNYFLEASIAAGRFNDPDIVEEGLRLGLTTHLAAGRNGAYPPLLLAAPWAHSEGYDALETSLYILAAESYLAISEADRAGGLLDDAQRAMRRREMRIGAVGARLNYQTALLEFHRGNGKTGRAALDDALAYQQKSSLRLFHAVLGDRAYTTNSITARVAKDLYSVVLREPNQADWLLDPLDAMAAGMNRLEAPMQRWFETAIERKEPELALEITDRIRRRRFLSRLPLGGRLHTLRAVMEAPQASLTEAAVLQRQDLLVRYPRYAELQRQSETIRRGLEALPLTPADARAVSQQKKLFASWAEVSAAQEAMLGEISLRREPADIVFPPLRTVDDLRATMGPRQLTLSFFNTSQYLYAFLFTKDRYVHWQVESPEQVQQLLAAMYKEMGLFDANQVLTGDQLRAGGWREPAQQLLSLLVRDVAPEFWDDYDELVVVPDHLLWYVPFEMLQLPVDGGAVPLISKVRVRYAPTVGTTAPDGRGRKQRARTLVVTGRLFPRDDDGPSQAAFEELRRFWPDASSLSRETPAATSLVTALYDRLVVYDDVEDPARASLAWSPAQVDRGRSGSTLADWLPLPWGGPDQIVLPGFHTPAENGLRKKADGDEMFMTMCGLMAAGARTVLISRWRPAGQSSYDLVREYLRVLPRDEASNAWQRSVFLLRDAAVDPELEPRVNLSPADDQMKTDHPFFWGGYMLIDTGVRPVRDPAAVAAGE